MELAHGPAAPVTLDLSSVELSFAEEDVETAALAPNVPAPSPSEPPKPPEEKPPDPDTERPDDLPPDPEMVEIPEPEPECERMETPNVPLDEKSKESEEVVQSRAPVPVAAPRQAKVDAPPKPKKTIRPEYPMGARRRGEHGDVVVEILVGERGEVAHVAVVESSGFAELDKAAAKAAKKASFTPAKSGSKPIASTARLKFTFELR